MRLQTLLFLVLVGFTTLILAQEDHRIQTFGDDKFEDPKPYDSVLDDADIKANAGWWHGFFASFSVILVSEIGDKTFFIAAILAMKYSRIVVLTGAFGALAVMTALSAGMGHMVTFIPKVYTFYVSTFLFVIFGVKMLNEGMKMDDTEGAEELEEVTQEIKEKERELDEAKLANDVESYPAGSPPLSDNPSDRWLRDVKNGILLQAFVMTFLAEWGDRSQITTVILGARENAFAVTVGGSLGHFLCTSLAVIGGRILAQKISVKTVTLIGGVVFLLFAASSLIFGMD